MPIEVKHLSYTYQPNTPTAVSALKDICFTIPDGSFIGVIGSTGSGKSTLMQHLNGLILPQQGSVVVDGIEIQKNTDRRAVRMKVGMVFQYPEAQLFEETVRKDVCFGPRNMGCTEEESMQRAEQALRTMGLDPEEIGEKSPFALSGGQMRRVAIAGVLAMQPRYLILDEPLAGLDPGGMRELMETITALHRESGVAVVMVSHDMDEIAAVADHILVMNQGSVVQFDTPEAVFMDGRKLPELGLALPQTAQVAQALRARGLNIPFCRTLEELVNEIASAKGGAER